VTRAISERVHYFFEKEPDRVNRIKIALDTYFTDLDKLALNDRLLKKFPGSGSIIITSFFSLLYMIFGLPVFLFGFVNNYLPYKIPNWVSRKITKLPQFYGAITMIAGTFTFLIFYSIQLWLVQHYLHNILITLCYIILLPLSGFFAFFYWKRFTNLRGRWMIFSLFYKRTGLITSLISMRRQIIDELEKGRREYSEKIV